MHPLRGAIAIVGAADTSVGVVPHMGATELCVDAALRALADAGLRKDQVDGLITCNAMAEPRSSARSIAMMPNWAATQRNLPTAGE